MNKPENDRDMEYRSVPHRLGPAQDPSAVRRYDLQNDRVSVVHSGETDPMPNREAQDAIASLFDEEEPASSPDDDDNDFEAQQGLAEYAGLDEDENTDELEGEEVA